MLPTQYPDINELLDILLADMQSVLGEKLAALYLYGSLVWGDFDHNSSDIDLLAATRTDITDEEADALKQMHSAFADAHKAWLDRIEVQYLSLQGLRTYKLHASKMGAISPGEPFHVIEAGYEYAINWYSVQEKGVTLLGPPPGDVIEPISQAEFKVIVRQLVETWPGRITRVANSRPGQSYAVLTLCRALYATRYGQQVSKKAAALWAARELPEWASLIQNALVWREEAVTLRGTPQAAEIDHAANFPQAKRFVDQICGMILSEGGKSGS